MAAGAGAHQDQPVDAGSQRALRMLDVGDVVEDQPAVAVRRLDHGIGCAQAGDQDRHAVFHAQVEVVLQPVVARMDDLVDRERRHHRVRMRRPVGRQFSRDPRQPFVEQFRRPRVQGREAADDAGLALRQHEIRVGDDEQRGADGGQAQVLQQRGKGHGRVRTRAAKRRLDHRRPRPFSTGARRSRSAPTCRHAACPRPARRRVHAAR